MWCKLGREFTNYSRQAGQKLKSDSSPCHFLVEEKRLEPFLLFRKSKGLCRKRHYHMEENITDLISFDLFLNRSLDYVRWKTLSVIIRMDVQLNLTNLLGESSQMAERRWVLQWV